MSDPLKRLEGDAVTAARADVAAATRAATQAEGRAQGFLRRNVWALLGIVVAAVAVAAAVVALR